MEWEYETYAVADLKTFTDGLNRFGADGWEVVSVVKASTTTEQVPVGVGGTMERPGERKWVAVLKRHRDP